MPSARDTNMDLMEVLSPPASARDHQKSQVRVQRSLSSSSGVFQGSLTFLFVEKKTRQKKGLPNVVKQGEFERALSHVG